MIKLAKRLSELRKAKNLKQEEVAALCDISLMSFRRYEKGTREPPATVLWKMADVFDVSIDYLVGRTDTK